MNDDLDINSFHKLLQSDDDDNGLVAALRKLTEVQDLQEIVRDSPQPLGTWVGWSYS
jgi:hypothetical protein